MNAIKLVVMAILAMVFITPVMAAEQTKQVQAKKVDMKKKGWLLKSMGPIAPPPGIDKQMVQCGINGWAYGSCKNGPVGKITK